ncbi:hypothetical protein [Affinirhizobium pseudoryzae]|uniref:hypothetical protein n=1 Tax=Allorhizobium pseudoryzae TaxID=379684 RepID=UPI0013EB7C76|nr:hypothetical protein [Allorhizobium pseudoryzae]
MPFYVKLLFSCLLFGIALVNAGHAQDVGADYLGPWKQVASNAGRCDRCEIRFDSASGQMIVTANNGWTARVGMVRNGRMTELQGQGAWSSTLRGNLRGHRFDVTFRLVGDELYLSMRMIDPTAKPRFVKGVFQRHWLGS